MCHDNKKSNFANFGVIHVKLRAVLGLKETIVKKTLNIYNFVGFASPTKNELKGKME